MILPLAGASLGEARAAGNAARGLADPAFAGILAGSGMPSGEAIMTRTLLDKLGWKPGMAARTAGLTPGLAPLFDDLGAGDAAEPDFLLGVCPDSAGIAARVADLLPLYPPGARLWLVYPKKSGRIATDINRDVGWDAVEGAGFLGVTQVAVDADWSALRFRRREEIPKLTRKF